MQELGILSNPQPWGSVKRNERDDERNPAVSRARRRNEEGSVLERFSEEDTFQYEFRFVQRGVDELEGHVDGGGGTAWGRGGGDTGSIEGGGGGIFEKGEGIGRYFT